MTPSRIRNAFFMLPATKGGRRSVVLFLAGFGVAVVNGALLESLNLTVGRLQAVPAIAAAIFVIAVAEGVVAIAREGERSWAVWFATVVLAVVLGAEVLSMLIRTG
jgi:hypothetical protein